MTIDIGMPQADIPLMSAPFDGTGSPYRGSSARGWIAVAIVILVVLGILWVAYSDALGYLPPTTPPS